jgi:hypothetical protein
MKNSREKMKMTTNGHLENRRRFVAGLASSAVVAPVVLSESRARAAKILQDRRRFVVARIQVGS